MPACQSVTVEVRVATMQTLHLLLVGRASQKREAILFLATIFETQCRWLRWKPGSHLPYIVRVAETTILLSLTSVLVGSPIVGASCIGVGLTITTARHSLFLKAIRGP